MKTSILIATYNGAAYIEEFLVSVLNQTVTADEVLISDDLSDDRTCNIVNKFIERHQLSHWQLHVNQTRLGGQKNFARLAGLATGDIVFLADQDDIWRLDKIEKTLTFFATHPQAEFVAMTHGIIGGGEVSSSRIKRYIDKFYLKQRARLPEMNQTISVYTMQDAPMLGNCSIAIKNNIAKIASEIMPLLNLWFDSSALLISGYRKTAYFNNQTVSYYRISDTSVMANNALALTKERRLNKLMDEKRRLAMVTHYPNQDLLEYIAAHTHYKYIDMNFLQARINSIEKPSLINMIRLAKYFIKYPRKMIFYKICGDILAGIKR